MKLTIDIEARLAQFQDQLSSIGKTGDRTAKKLDRAFGGLRSTLATLGVGLSAGALVSFVKSGIDAADNLAKLSQRIGISVESLSAFNFAAKLSDVSTEQLNQGLKRLAANAVDVQAGTGEAKDAFKALRIEVEASKGQLKSTETLLLEIAEKFSGIEDGAGKTALAMKIFGRSGAELIPLLNQGSAGFEKLREEAERLGLIISTKTAQAAERFNDDMTRLTSATDKLKFSIAEGALPALNSFVTQLLEGQRIAGGFTDAILILGTTNPFRSAAENVKVLTAELERLERLNRAGVRLQQPGFDTKAQEDRVRKQLEFAKFLQREEALALGAGIGRDERQRFGGTGPALLAAPALPDEAAIKKAQAALEKLKSEQARATQALAEFNDEVQQGAFEALNDQQRALADQSRRVADEITAAQQALAEFDAEVQQGAFEALNDQQRALAESGRETNAIFEDLGFTFSSAFEDAIIQAESLRDVMQGLLEDIARIIIRRNVVKPLAEGISSFASGLFGAAEGGIFQGGFRAFSSGGIVTRPTLGLVGEGGQNEAVIPLPDGKNVPVKIEGGRGGVVVNVINQGGGQPLEVTGQTQRQGPDGQTVVDVMVKESFGRLAGRGQLDGIMRQFGARRPGVA